MKSNNWQVCKSVLKLVDNPTIGLPDEVFNLVCKLTPLLNVDLVIKSSSHKTLLTWRDDFFFGPGWHVPGGIVRLKETCESRAVLVAKNELKIDIEEAQIKLIHLHEHISKNKLRGHGLALVYLCSLEDTVSLRFSDFHESHINIHGDSAWHADCPANLIPEQKPLKEVIFGSHQHSTFSFKSQAIFD